MCNLQDKILLKTIDSWGGLVNCTQKFSSTHRFSPLILFYQISKFYLTRLGSGLNFGYLKQKSGLWKKRRDRK